MSKKESFLTPAELAERWKLSKGHLDNMRSQGKGPKFLKLGRNIRYPMAVILAYENANTHSEA